MKSAVKTISRENKTIAVTKDFMMKAGKFGTPEFNEMMELRAKYAGYTFVEHKIARNPEKQTYGKLTYEVMEQFILNHEKDAAVRKNVWEEFQYVRKIALTFKKGAYTSVKKWFIEKYKDVFDAEKAEKEAAAEEKKMKKYTISAEDLALPTEEE